MSKISIAEAILLLMYVGATDLLGFLLIFVGLDDFFLLDLFTFPVTQIYFRIKGVRAGYDLAMNGLELIPYVGFLPLRTLGAAIVIWKDRHQEEAPKMEEETFKFVPAKLEYIPKEEAPKMEEETFKFVPAKLEYIPREAGEKREAA